MKECKAKKMRCPQTGLRDFCIGSYCMAWRWDNERNPDYKPVMHMMAMSPRHPADDQSPWVKSNIQGHCGLAGTP